MMCILFLIFYALNMHANEEPLIKISKQDQKEIEAIIEQSNLEKLVDKIFPHNQRPFPLNEALVEYAYNYYKLKAADYEHAKKNNTKNDIALMHAWSVATFLAVERASQLFEKFPAELSKG